MTAKLIAMYRKPDDVAAFDKAYFETHVPLVQKMPGLLAMHVNKLQKNFMSGSEAPYHLIVELVFEDEAALNKAMSSPEGKAAGANLMSFAAKVTTLLVAEEIQPAAVVG